MKPVIKKQLEIYVTPEGKRPFIDWLEALKDKKARFRIKERLDRMSLGNLGDYKSLGNGLYEIRLAFGPGYRIYCGQEDDRIILLLCAGDKSTQKADIKKASVLWKNYLER